MTVCIAALCDNGSMVVCASDRMLTAGDIQFEPPQTKVWQLTTSIVLLVAGHAPMQSEICQRVYNDIAPRVQQNPTEWLQVSDIADLYLQYYNQARFTRAAQKVLAPLGMDFDTYLGRQKDMKSALVKAIATELRSYRAPEVETIVAGRDNTGGHIYHVHNGDVSCQDAAGFLSIGIGSWHANSQFMFAGHTRFAAFPQTLLLAYSAKKRAEVAPGVGAATDMCIIGPQLGATFPVPDDILSSLDQVYSRVRRQESKAIIKAEQSFQEYLKQLLARKAEAQQAAAIPQDTQPDETSDPKEIPDDRDKG